MSVRCLFVCVLAAWLCACVNTLVDDGPPRRSVNIDAISDPVPHYLPKSHYGNPPTYVVDGKSYHVMASAQGYHERGIASWYGTKFHAKRTSSGEPYNMYAMTAAHKSLPIPTFVRVTNLNNGRQVILKVNDRGPFVANRLIDLSYVAAKKLGIVAHGTGLVEVDAIDLSDPWNSPEPQLKSHPQLYLQVGAFSDRTNAERLVGRLTHIVDARARIRTTHDGAHPLYRVQVGPIKNVDDSDKFYQQIKRAGLGEPISVVL